jgi:hypothetical protein
LDKVTSLHSRKEFEMSEQYGGRVERENGIKIKRHWKHIHPIAE